MRKLFFIIVTAIGMMQIPMQSINAQNMKKEEVPQNISAFPVGKANTGFEQRVSFVHQQYTPHRKTQKHKLLPVRLSYHHFSPPVPPMKARPLLTRT